MVFTDVDASYGNRTIRYVIKTADQVDKAGFCTSGTPDDPYGLAGADRDIDILQNGFLTVFLIAEIYMIEDDTSVTGSSGSVMSAVSLITSVTRSALAILIVTITKTMESIIRLMRMFMQ